MTFSSFGTVWRRILICSVYNWILWRMMSSSPSHIPLQKFSFLTQRCINRKVNLLLICLLKQRIKTMFYTSNHPKQMVDSLPWSQLLRVRRIVSDVEKVDIRLEEMCNKFVRRGYPKQLLQKYKEEGKQMDREVLLKPVKREDNKSECIPFVSTFDPQSKKISNILCKHWSIIRQGCPNIKAFSCLPLMSYKRDKNWRDTLVKSDVGPPKIIVYKKH